LEYCAVACCSGATGNLLMALVVLARFHWLYYKQHKKMNIISCAFLIGCQLVSVSNVVCPFYPAKAVRGGNVVAVLETSKGLVSRVVILHGDEPFVEPTRSALVQWRMPNELGDKSALVVVNFRDPYLTMESSDKGVVLGPQSHTIKAAPYRGGVALPTLVVDPFYPSASMVVMGAAVLHLKITSSGAVGEVQAIQELGDLTQSAIDSAKKWTFIPARDQANKAIGSDAFAIFVYRPLQNPCDP
jgi:hypothetical protein